MEDGCKVYMDSYMASNGSRFHGHMDYFQEPPLGGSPDTNRETMALRTLTTVGLFYFITCEDPHE